MGRAQWQAAWTKLRVIGCWIARSGCSSFSANVQQLKVQPVHTVDSYRREGSVLWLASLPVHRAVTSAHRGGDPAPDDPLLPVIDRVPRIDPPAPPASLMGWLAGSFDDPSRPPELRGPRRGGRGRGRDGEGEAITSTTVTIDRTRHLGSVRRLAADVAGVGRSGAARSAGAGSVRRVVLRLRCGDRQPRDGRIGRGVGCLAWTPQSHPTVKRHLLTCR